MATKKAVKKVTSLQGKHTGAAAVPLRLPALEVQQGDTTLYLTSAKASALFDSLSINRKVEDKFEGYQRALSVSRVDAISRYILQGNALPGSIIVAFDEATFDQATGTLIVPAGTDIGWVIDGQHRLAGAKGAADQGQDIALAVVAFVGLGEKQQIETFVTINREAKNVPTSLYLDLLRVLPLKSASDFAKERAADIAAALKADEASPFYNRIVTMSAPRVGQLSLTNFTRKVAPLVTPEKGFLAAYTEREQSQIVANYYQGLRQVFPQEFDSQNSVFFRTIGFGALWNVFQSVFTLTLKEHQAFKVQDVAAIFKMIEHFDFSGWKEYGSGSAAEIAAGNDLRTALQVALNARGPSHSGTLQL